MTTIQQLVPWFTHHPTTAVIVLYATTVLAVLIYTYFEPRDQS